MTSPASDDGVTEPTDRDARFTESAFYVERVSYSARSERGPVLRVDVVAEGGPLHGLLLSAYVPEAVVASTLQGRALGRAALDAQESRNER